MEEWMLWGALSLLRVIWCLAPQKGYLHPDEFFQSPEVMAGDILDLDTNRPWEFLPAFPCRTVLIPLLTSGTAFWIVRILHQLGFQTAFNYSYLLLVLPRLFITVLSFLLDYAVYRVAPVYASNPWKALLLLSASHVTLVFYTRTISNAIEGILFALLLLLTCPSSCNITSRCKRPKAYHLIGMVLAAGFFNRPTFLCFAFMPVLYWASQNDLSRFSYTSFINLIKLLPSTIVTSTIFIVSDTMYYTGHYPFLINNMDIYAHYQRQNIILTPFKFLHYNLNPNNLAQHGIHHPITHLAVNSPMLFGLLHLSAVFSGLNLLKKRIWPKYSPHNTECERPSSQEARLLLFYFVPLTALSLFNHQEPRFLIPLVLPLVLLVSSYSRTTKIKCVIVMFNVLGALFFGCLHQAGLIPGIFHIQHILQSTSSSGNMSHHHTILFTHTYMPPHYLLNLKKGQTSVDIIDLAGFNEDQLCQKLQDIQGDLTQRNEQLQGSISHHFIVVLPGTVIPVIDNCGLDYRSDTWFIPHVSMEDPPMISHLLKGNFMRYLALHVIELEMPTTR
ncbi:PREDICTED: GPI mannosyltransferase 4 [Nanorana parkeri]|uniref:GPI mannosyltransferase 4 n=1 Tax=Nanorana parkeri TaxID=125878 RepID=UPI000854A578|nr:PREDICTED: GPI mannosyltransferase 4 [Nanorana parkeri]